MATVAPVPRQPRHRRRRPAPAAAACSGRRAAPVAHADRPRAGRAARVRIAIFGPYFAPHRPDRVRRRAEPDPRRRRCASAPTTSARTCWSRFLYGGRSILVLSVAATADRPRRRHRDRARRRLRAQLARRRADAPDGRAARLPGDRAGARRHRHRRPASCGSSSSRSRSRRCRASPACIRGAALTIVERDFIGAAEALGESRAAHPVRRGPAERHQPAGGRGEPAADVRRRPHRRRWASSASRADRQRRRLGPDDQREPDRADACSRGAWCCRSSRSRC